MSGSGRPETPFDLAGELDAHGMHLAPPQSGQGLIVMDSGEAGAPFVLPVQAEHRLSPLGNEDLPVFALRDQIISAVTQNPVTILTAETGAGKSTQIPQFLLDAGFSKITLTQPRRAAAWSLMRRIKSELADVRGDGFASDSIRYQTAGGSEGPDDAPINVVTDGLQLVRELHYKGTMPGEALIIDEAHEWNGNIELLVGWVRDRIQHNPDLRVLIMSATMDTQSLAVFYEEACGARPPIIDAKNERNFPVDQAERPDSTVEDQIMEALMHELHLPKEKTEGPQGCLAFVPGKREIGDVIQSIKRRIPPEFKNRVKVFPLHSKLPQAAQEAAIAEHEGYIKIVVSTDVAQTSLTPMGIKYVVDSGLQRRVDIDDEGIHGLDLVLTSEADCRQRAGRCGRVAPGVYRLTRLNQLTPFVRRADRDPYPIPEMVRTDAARYTLQFLDLGIDIEQFDFFHPASSHIIELGKKKLRRLGAIDERGDITELGRSMCNFPLGVEAARIAVEATNHSHKIRQYVAAMVASYEAGGLQYYIDNAGTRWQQLTEETQSDLLVQLDLFLGAQSVSEPQQLFDLDLDIDNLKRAQEQYAKIAKLLGVTDDGILGSPTDGEREEILDCIYAGFSPHIYAQSYDGTYVHAFDAGHQTPLALSKRSVVAKGAGRYVMGVPRSVTAFVGSGSERTHFLQDVTMIGSAALDGVAKDHLTWRSTEYKMVDGVFRLIQAKQFFGHDQGITRAISPPPSPETRRAVIEYVQENPGYALQQLRALKSELEQLDRRSKDPVRLLTDKELRGLIEQAAGEYVTSPDEIEDQLFMMILDPTNGLTLDDFIAPEEREMIIANSPDSLDIQGGVLHIAYRGRRSPYVRTYSPSLVRLLDTPPQLPDGREVLFSRQNDSKKYTLREIQAILGSGDE